MVIGWLSSAEAAGAVEAGADEVVDELCWGAHPVIAAVIAPSTASVLIDVRTCMCSFLETRVNKHDGEEMSAMLDLARLRALNRSAVKIWRISFDN